MRTLSSLLISSSLVAALSLTGCGGGSEAVTAAPTSGTPTASGCTKSSAKIGKSATLSTRAHGVSGKATVVDDCTITITNFFYDGGGAQSVFVYGGLAGNYGQGFAIGSNIKGVSYTGQTLTLTLKTGDLDKLDGLSIWCSDVRVSFGDGLFI